MSENESIHPAVIGVGGQSTTCPHVCKEERNQRLLQYLRKEYENA